MATPGQIAFLERLGYEAHPDFKKLPPAEASRLIGRLQAQRSPRPALRLRPAEKPPRRYGKREKKRSKR